ncbi:AP2/ERF domain-containing protein [Psidium guajava]|nr:AP2/ERF domain-containing protein [Psidium guajava]
MISFNSKRYWVQERNSQGTQEGAAEAYDMAAIQNSGECRHQPRRRYLRQPPEEERHSHESLQLRPAITIAATASRREIDHRHDDDNRNWSDSPAAEPQNQPQLPQMKASTAGDGELPWTFCADMGFTQLLIPYLPSLFAGINGFKDDIDSIFDLWSPGKRRCVDGD